MLVVVLVVGVLMGMWCEGDVVVFMCTILGVVESSWFWELFLLVLDVFFH